MVLGDSETVELFSGLLPFRTLALLLDKCRSSRVLNGYSIVAAVAFTVGELDLKLAQASSGDVDV